jgi:hypothetical protein
MRSLVNLGSICLLLMCTAGHCLASAEPGDETPKPLSVAPLDHIVYPEHRPRWIDSARPLDLDSASFVVVSGPCDTPEESLDELQRMLRAAVSTYISQLCDAAGQTDFCPLSDEQIDRELVLRRYSGTVVQGDMTRHEHAVEVGFSEAKRQEIMTAWNNIAVRQRLGAIGALVGGGFATLVLSSAWLSLLGRRGERRQPGQAPS